MLLKKRIILIIVKKIPHSGTDNYASMTDEELVAQIVNTNNSLLFGVLYDRFSKKVYNKCIGFVKNEDDAKDLTQDIFIKLFFNLSRFKKQSKFSTWLYSFTYNFCINYINRDKAKKMSDISSSLDDHEYHLSSVEEVDEQELFELKANKLSEALELIAPEYKAILLLKYQDDVSLKELGKLLGAGESAIKMRISRAKKKVIEAYKTIE